MGKRAEKLKCEAQRMDLDVRLKSEAREGSEYVSRLNKDNLVRKER
jgi:hypothetical protein